MPGAAVPCCHQTLHSLDYRNDAGLCMSTCCIVCKAEAEPSEGLVIRSACAGRFNSVDHACFVVLQSQDFGTGQLEDGSGEGAGV
jgi:hypothetical protein